ncbi:MAG: hypothetical protein WD049_10365 [Candidatus Paceibacterota bacterium]
MATRSTPSQKFIPIKEIRDDVAILKNGSLRAILMTSTVNFGLKSKEEQESTLYQFQNFLNSLDFSTQICIQSRELDIRPYIQRLEERQKEQVNDLLKIQTKEYIEFIKTFTAKTNIMSKHFYVVVPYTPTVSTSSGGGILGGLKSLIGKGGTSEEKKEADKQSFEQQRSQLEARVSVVEQGLIRTGVRAARLGTDEITELFYQTFNPGETDLPTTGAEEEK